MRTIKLCFLLCCAALFLAAQPTIGLYQRVWMIKTQYGRGTAFAADVSGREYWITAAHLLTGAKGKPYGRIKDKSVTIELLAPRVPDGATGEQWVRTTFGVLQPAEDVDLVVLIPSQVIVETQEPGPTITGSVMFGGNCEFMGFPYGGGWRLKMNGQNYWAAFNKHCGISGMDQDAKLWILDGINNAGFSGGPVYIGTGEKQQIIGVISGYRQEPAEVIKGKPAPANEPKDTVALNSGFILAYSIGIAEDLIKKNPIGPPRQAKK